MGSMEKLHRRWQALLRPRLRLVRPGFYFLAVIYYEELFLKLYCLYGVSPVGALFTLLFTVPIAMGLGLLCGGVSPGKGRVLLVLCTGLISLWLGAQAVYYHLFKTFLTIFSLTKMGMVAGAFGGMATTEIILNWFPILMMALPVIFAAVGRKKIVRDQPTRRACASGGPWRPFWCSWR